MAGVRPTDGLPEWASSDVVDPTSGQNNKVEPPAGWKSNGWSYQEKPPRNYDNWQKWQYYKWIEYLDLACVRPATYFVAASDATDESRAHADAVCDGVSDEAQLQEALSAIAAAGGGLLLLSEGTFTVNGGLTIGISVHIRGAGIGATVIKVDAAASTDFAILSAINKTEISVAELSIDGTGGSVAQNHTGILIDTCSEVTIHDVQVFQIAYDSGLYTGGNGAGVNIDDSTQVTLSRCTIKNNGGIGVIVSGASHSVIIDACNLQTNVVYGAFLTGYGGVVSSCVVRDNGDAGILVSGERWSIVGCDIRDNDGDGIELAGAWIIISGCKIFGNGLHGIDMSTVDCYSCVIDMNIIEGNSQGADNTSSGINITADVSGCSIRGNVIHKGAGVNKHKYGISVAGAPNTSVIHGNHMIDAGSTLPFNGTAKTDPEWVGSAAGTNVQHDITRANHIA